MDSNLQHHMKGNIFVYAFYLLVSTIISKRGLHWVYIGRCQKNLICGSVTCVFGHKKSSFVVFFFENGGDDKNDNHILVGSKLNVACSESTRCRGLTIFENEAVKAKTRPSFYSKICNQKFP